MSVSSLLGSSWALMISPTTASQPAWGNTLPNYCRGIFVLGVQLRPPLGVGDGLFLLTIEILIAIGHPHIPLRLVLAFLPAGLQHLNGCLLYTSHQFRQLSGVSRPSTRSRSFAVNDSVFIGVHALSPPSLPHYSVAQSSFIFGISILSIH